MKALYLMAFLVSVVPWSADAQIRDNEQKKAWFYLQHLAGEAEQIDSCIILQLAVNPKYNSALARKRYYAITDELSREAEAYIKKYAALVEGTNETPHAFAYRVWSAALSVGARKRVANPSDPICRILTSP